MAHESKQSVHYSHTHSTGLFVSLCEAGLICPDLEALYLIRLEAAKGAGFPAAVLTVSLVAVDFNTLD